ncbi:geranyl-CoA carboxylase alpha subunit [Ferrimonas sediminum]|uniref:Biotin carboxylase n=1 Tax=Ferrimonas sediminum TaxID=718193 RepID=A0A1G8S3Z5_9GAMM|nr:biotin carboxylase N-terminal domain-containing protein [Ferrimonas sediminum]SDJ23984.1 geranyl-CoA carboxylase alpha subunit [Ferrimonas sediminum]
MRFHTVLIANRGEIAVRLLKGARQQGYRTVAVYSDADRQAPHVELADEAVCIGGGDVKSSYLNPQVLLDAARQSRADALHPGYGFLSENADFARRCRAQGLTFIGPGADAIEMMGNKRLAKLAMLEAGVPCIPGYQGQDQSDGRLMEEAGQIGMPVMIKAAAGGGGRGMRLVQDEEALLQQIASARSEALHGFGSDELILEKALISPRHIEIQILADTHGHCIHLAERDCSVQRRHQKVLEEAPSPAVSPELRRRMGQAAILAAQSCHYQGAGTVEFLLDSDNRFYFLEMNTRLQVEHPVTEMVTGLDLVEWQLRIAAGAPLDVPQEQVQINGHAIEARLYAEDPAQAFRPQTGTVRLWQPSQADGIRIDAGIDEGQAIGSHYDPMLAKLIAWAPDRTTAVRRLNRALLDSPLLGVTNNRHFLSNLLCHPTFINGQASTGFIAEQFSNDPSMTTTKPESKLWAMAAALFSESQRNSTGLAPLRHGPAQSSIFTLAAGEHPCAVTVTAEAGTLRIQAEGWQHRCRVVRRQQYRWLVEIDGIGLWVAAVHQDKQLWLDFRGQQFHVKSIGHQRRDTSSQQGDGEVRALMDGCVQTVHVSLGDEVTQGQTLLVMEAMKMEMPLKANRCGRVSRLQVQEGQQVTSRQLLVAIAD